ncbi:hypothetical protein C8J48_0839 [Desmospora activa DSM 45169]|uniref:Uncharacterized protein n=1 Tax=Desmospora activa DSM 45169 TaxID=1121389 RepID=A0A2T4Z8N8_9BACL|nr:hypothetical protein C8J48_0839 [Desmospora activa DSM 45169]
MPLLTKNLWLLSDRNLDCFLFRHVDFAKLEIYRAMSTPHSPARWTVAPWSSLNFSQGLFFTLITDHE